MPTLTPVEGDPFAKADDSGVPHITIRKSNKDASDPKLTPVDGDPFASEDGPEVKQDSSISGGMKRGFLERGTGVDMLLNQIGVGSVVPVYRDGKITFGLPPNEELAKQGKELEAEGEGTGIKGSLAELAGDPLSYMPSPAKLGMMAKGGIQSALSAISSPSTDGKQTLGQRGIDTAIAAPIGMITGGALGKAGQKVAGKSVPESGKLTDPSELYQLAQKMGLKFTGKEAPQEIWNKIQEAVKTKVGELAEKANPGSSTSRMWEVGTNLATSKMYAAALEKNNVLYSVAHKLGEKESIPVEGIANDISDLIDHMEKQAPYQAANPKFGTTIQTLKDLHAEIQNGGKEALNEDPWTRIQRMMADGAKEETPKITGNQLIALDQALNENFGRTGGSGSSGRALEQLQNKVQSAIKGMSPKFSSAYQKAKDDFRQNIVQNFRENPVLGKYWHEDDFRSYEAMAKGIALPPALKARVNGMLDKIKSFNDLSELKQHLDPATYNNVRASKFIQIMNKAGLDAKKLNDEKTYSMLEKTLANKPEDLAALHAIKTFNEEMTRRGLEKSVSPVELQESEKLKDRMFRTVFSFTTGHKLYGIRHAVEALKGDVPTGIKGRLTGLAEDVAKGAPKPIYKPGAIPQVVSKGVATKEGLNSDDQRKLTGQ